jgi:hypothetical protein
MILHGKDDLVKEYIEDLNEEVNIKFFSLGRL